jgi:hypothetical protein
VADADFNAYFWRMPTLRRQAWAFALHLGCLFLSRFRFHNHCRFNKKILPKVFELQTSDEEYRPQDPRKHIGPVPSSKVANFRKLQVTYGRYGTGWRTVRSFSICHLAPLVSSEGYLPPPQQLRTAVRTVPDRPLWTLIDHFYMHWLIQPGQPTYILEHTLSLQLHINALVTSIRY